MLTRHATREYHAPENTSALFALLAAPVPNTALLAGGISLHWRGCRASRLIDLRHIISSSVSVTDGTVAIGAGTTVAAAAAAHLPAPLTALRQACARLASPQIRNVATLGGNLISHFDFSDTLGPLYLLAPNLRLITRDGAVTRPFTELLVKDRFTLPANTVLDAFIFPAARLAQWRGGRHHKESRLGRDLATLGLTILDRTDGAFDLALTAYWLQVRCWHAVTNAADLQAQLAALPPPKSDQRATADQRRRLLAALLDRLLAGGAA